MTKHISGGYIGITSALIITVTLVVIVTTISLVSVFTRVDVSGTHFKEKSSALARSCVSAALLKIARTSTYAGGETLNVGSDTCSIVSVAASSGVRIISAQGIYDNSYTNLLVTIPSSSVSVIGWSEVQHF
jgi:hypothetical protein